METHYLIDYENDGKNGLKGCEKLTISDFIHLFYTDNSKNTTLDIFTNHGKAELDIKKVPAGDQSLDKHLIAYLGYLVGKSANIRTEYVIISSDKLVGLAACSADCDNMWQIGVDVLPEYRRMGIASSLDSRKRDEDTTSRIAANP